MKNQYKSIGTVDAGTFGGRMGAGGYVSSAPIRMNDSAIANGGAFLASELEKLDPKISEPLSSITYPRDIRVKVGGGWVDTIAKLNIDYGVPGGSGNGSVTAPGSNTDTIVQAKISKDVFTTHLYSSTLRIPFVDMQRQQVTGRSLEQLLTEVIRLNYDKHMETNVYLGLESYGTTGLLNNPNVTAQPVTTGAGGSTAWAEKTPDEILADVNAAIMAGWAASEYDLSAIPNHILVPYMQYTLLQTTKVSPLAEKTIMTFLLENNIATLNGGSLVIGATAFCKEAGAGNTDRMAAYVNSDRFVAVEELVPLARTMTQPNTDKKSYDSIYMANLSEVEVFYEQPITYWDGI
jgi:hypothetical protein